MTPLNKRVPNVPNMCPDVPRHTLAKHVPMCPAPKGAHDICLVFDHDQNSEKSWAHVAGELMEEISKLSGMSVTKPDFGRFDALCV